MGEQLAVSKKDIINLIASIKGVEKRYVSIELKVNLKIKALYDDILDGGKLKKQDLRLLEDFLLDKIGNFKLKKSKDIQSLDALIEWQIILEKGLYKRMEALENKIQKQEHFTTIKPIAIINSYNRLFRMYGMNSNQKSLKKEFSRLDNIIENET